MGGFVPVCLWSAPQPIRSEGGCGGAFGAQQYVLAAGPRAISSTFRHEPGLLGFLLVLNDVLVHPAALHLFVFRLEALWDCTLCSQRHVSEWWSGGRVLFAC